MLENYKKLNNEKNFDLIYLKLNNKKIIIIERSQTQSDHCTHLI